MSANIRRGLRKVYRFRFTPFGEDSAPQLIYLYRYTTRVVGLHGWPAVSGVLYGTSSRQLFAAQCLEPLDHATRAWWTEQAVVGAAS